MSKIPAQISTLPEGWQRKPLKFAATLRLDRSVGSPESTGYVGLENIESWTGKFIPTKTTESKTQEISTSSGTTSSFYEGDVLFGKLRPYLAKVWLADSSGICTTELLPLNPLPSFDGRFLKYILLDAEFITRVESSTFGAKMPRANWDFIGGVDVLVPPRSKQVEIANAVDKEVQRIDALVANKARMLSLLKQKRTTLISSAVTCGLDTRASTKASGLDWLGEIPKLWDCQRCATIFVEKDDRGEPNLPLLIVSLNTGVNLRVFSKDKIESVAEDLATMKIARKGDLVFNKMRFWQGAAGIAPADGLVSPDYTVASISKRLLPEYIEKLFRTPRFSSEVKRYSYGMVDDRLRLYWDAFKNIRVPIPPIEEQKHILAFLKTEERKIEALSARLIESVQLLKERRSALITAAVTGQISIEGMAA